MPNVKKRWGHYNRFSAKPSRTPVGDLCRQLGISEATFYAWKTKYTHLGASELRRVRPLEEENSRLNGLVADLSLEKHMLSEALRKKVCGPPAVGNWPAAGHLSDQLNAGLLLGAIQPGGLVSTKSGTGSIGLTPADLESRPCAPTFWILTHLGTSASRRLAGELETEATALSTRGLAATHAGATSETYRVASRPGPGPGTGGPDRALEHGFRP